MASILFQEPSTSQHVPSTSTSALAIVDAAEQSGYNYWTTLALGRTRLSPNSDFYMDTTRLAEYQRYLGPECTKSKANRDGWPSYLKALIQQAAGGEGHFLKRLLERRKAQNGMTVLDDASTLAVFGTAKVQNTLWVYWTLVRRTNFV